MAQESREWYQNDNFGTDQQASEGPTGQFKGEEIEFESFMFDGGQSAGLGLTISGPLHLPQALAVAEAPMAPAPGPNAPFMGASADRQLGSDYLPSLRPSTPLGELAPDQPWPPSTPLTQATTGQNEAPRFSGSPATPPSGPLRHSGPLVDGRTLSSGPLQASSAESQPQSGAGSLEWPGMSSFGNEGSFNTGSLNTGPLGRLNTSALSPDMADQPQTGPLAHSGNGNGNGNGHGAYTPFVTGQSQSRLSGLLTTGPLGMRGEGTGPLNPPSRFMHSGPLTPADLPDELEMGTLQPEVTPLQSVPAPVFTPNPTPMPMLSDAPTLAPMPAPAHPSQPLPSDTQDGWSDSSLAAVEDFSMVLIAMNGAWRYTTSTSLSSGTLAEAGTTQEVAPIQDSGLLYSNPLPPVYDAGPRPAANEVAEATNVIEATDVVSAPQPAKTTRGAKSAKAAKAGRGGKSARGSKASKAAKATKVATAADVTNPVAERVDAIDTVDTVDSVDIAEESTQSIAYDSAPDDLMSWGKDATPEVWEAEALMPAVDAPPLVETPIDMDAVEIATEVEPPSDMAMDAPVEMATEDVSAPPSPPPVLHAEVSEGTFAGQSLEFEPFMFSGESLDKPELPNIGAFMPAVTAMESAFIPSDHASKPSTASMQSTAPASAPADYQANDLPFWLKGTGELSMPKLSDHFPATELPDFAALDAAMATPGLDATTALPPVSDDTADYSDLPPIDPFDFTAMGLSVQEEALGFNTEELSGFGGFSHDPMTATADLQVVASLLGTDPELSGMLSGPLDRMRAQEDVSPFEETIEPIAFTPIAPIMSTGPMASSIEALQEEESEEAESQPTEQFSSVPSTGQLEAQPRSWTATVTSSLSPDALRATGSLDDGATGLETEGFDVSPFSLTDMDLDDEEQPTGVLNVPRVRNTGPLNAIAAADMPYSAPKDRSQEKEEAQVAPAPAQQPQPSALKWSTSWLGDTTSVQTPQEHSTANITEQIAPTDAQDTPWQAQPAETHVQMSDISQDVQVESEPVFSFMRDEKLRTGSLGFADDMDSEEAGDTATTYGDTFEAQPFTFADDLAEQVGMAAPVQDPNPTPPAPPMPERYMQPEQPLVSAPTPATPHVASVVSTPYPPYQPMQAQPQAHVQPSASKFDVPEVRFPTSILSSGPLPSLDGFEELHALVDSNPSDVGAHMALAAAYSQVGDADTQLRVYRRVLRNPAVSNKILRLIAEELADYEASLTGHPHFHQVRGDLYMKQNRYTEAIAEYNRIG